jgi:uncharacterized membrane protein
VTGKHLRASETLVWLIIAIYAVATLLPSFFPGALSMSAQLGFVVFLPLAFAIIHGALRYGIAGIAAFVILCFVVSNVFENLGVLTGFPFGHYFYPDVMGPKLFVVPLLIGPAYFGAGYTSWVLASILLGDIDRDAAGATWRSADLHETAAIVSLVTMVFVAVTCLLILARREPGGARG